MQRTLLLRPWHSCRTAHLIDLPFQQQMILAGTPVCRGLGTPVFAQSCNLCEVLGSMIKVEYVMDLRGRQPSDLHQQGHASLYPRRFIGDQEDLVGLGDSEPLQIDGQESNDRIRSLEGAVNAGG